MANAPWKRQFQSASNWPEYSERTSYSRIMIPMLDLKLQYRMLQKEIDSAVAEVLSGTQYVQGPNVRRFENEVAKYLQVKHAISCNSGSDALHLAMRACGIGQDDEVITTPFSFAATAEAVAHVGATAVYVDIDPVTLCITAESIEPAISPKTRAILPVHIFGQAADMPGICALARRYGLQVIEDCAQSFGSRLAKQHTGTFGDASCFSFYPSKNLGGCGDGGLFATNSDELAAQFSLLKNHGCETRNRHHAVGWNSRLDELQAVILRIKLKHIDQFNRQRVLAASHYASLLGPLPVQIPRQTDDLSHVYHQYTILSQERTGIIDALQKHQIGHAVYYPIPLPRQKAFSSISRSLDLSNTDRVCRRCISLPIFPEISHSQIETVADTIKQVHAG